VRVHCPERRFAADIGVDKVLQTRGVEVDCPFARDAETRKLDARARLFLGTRAAYGVVEIQGGKARSELLALVFALLQAQHEELFNVVLLGV